MSLFKNSGRTEARKTFDRTHKKLDNYTNSAKGQLAMAKRGSRDPQLRKLNDAAAAAAKDPRLSWWDRNFRR